MLISFLRPHLQRLAGSIAQNHEFDECYQSSDWRASVREVHAHVQDCSSEGRTTPITTTLILSAPPRLSALCTSIELI